MTSYNNSPEKKIINFFSFLLIFIYSKVTYNYYSIGKKKLQYYNENYYAYQGT